MKSNPIMKYVAAKPYVIYNSFKFYVGDKVEFRGEKYLIRDISPICIIIGNDKYSIQIGQTCISKLIKL